MFAPAMVMRFGTRQGIVYNITQQPYFYETPLFRASIAAAGMLLLFGLYRYRLHRLAGRMNLRHEERLAERTRIARDLHDTLIQDINGLSLQIAALSKMVITPDAAKDRLRELKRQAEYCLREARQSVWDIRSAESDSSDFLTALRESGEQLTAGKPTRFSFMSEGVPKRLSANLRQQLLRIGREAIGNAAQHAQAEEIEVSVNFNAGSIRLRVSDNGRGFDVARAREAGGHFGLTTMNERAEQIKATIQISSTVGKGTSIEIAAPAGD